LALEEQPYGPGHKKLAGQIGFRVAVGAIRHRREACR
jgi:hypothetical protein